MERLAGERAQQLIHAERLASVGALAAGLFHELNSPVTFVDGHLQTLKKVWEAVEPHMPRLVEENPEDERLALAARSVPEVLHDALEGMRRIRETIHNMKGYAGRGQSEPLPFHVNEAIRAALRLCQSVLRHHAEVVEDLAPDLPPVVGHAAKLEQVFVNLFHNAADALDGRGDGRLRVASRLTEDGIEVIVEDDGPGLPADRIDRIWEPFYTEKSRGEGLGIGLAISHAIIEEMEGRILAENRPEGGARFTLTLPAGAKA
jgi:C4-dicarboxylate-specific signal transduction histidine kinase